MQRNLNEAEVALCTQCMLFYSLVDQSGDKYPLHSCLSSQEIEEHLGDIKCLTPVVTKVDPDSNAVPFELIDFIPSETHIFTILNPGSQDEIKTRQIFLHTPLDTREKKILQDFRSCCKSHKYKIPRVLEPVLLRILLHNHRKNPNDYLERSMEHAQLMMDWKSKNYPVCDDEPDLSADLAAGVMYWVGRDSFYRPLLIVNLSRLPKTEHIVSRFKRLTVFCFEWALRYLMIPGKVETCCVILDVRGVPIHKLPISALSDIVLTLTKQYPFRLTRMWILHDSFFIQSIWSIAKRFLSRQQQQKIAIMRSGYEENLLSLYREEQIEEAYGGIRPECQVFYPFPVAPGPYAFNFTSSSAKEILQNKCSPLIQKPWKVADECTAFGISWENSNEIPTLWCEEVNEVLQQLELLFKSPADFLKDVGIPASLSTINSSNIFHIEYNSPIEWYFGDNFNSIFKAKLLSDVSPEEKIHDAGVVSALKHHDFQKSRLRSFGKRPSHVHRAHSKKLPRMEFHQERFEVALAPQKFEDNKNGVCETLITPPRCDQVGSQERIPSALISEGRGELFTGSHGSSTSRKNLRDVQFDPKMEAYSFREVAPATTLDNSSGNSVTRKEENELSPPFSTEKDKDTKKCSFSRNCSCSLQ